VTTLARLETWFKSTDKETSRAEAKRRARALAKKLQLPVPRWAARLIAAPAPANDGPQLQPITQPLPWEIQGWVNRRPNRKVGRINGAVALVDGDTVRMYPTLTAACACAGR